MKSRHQEDLLAEKYLNALVNLEDRVEESKDQFRELGEKKMVVDLYNSRAQSAV